MSPNTYYIRRSFMGRTLLFYLVDRYYISNSATCKSRKATFFSFFSPWTHTILLSFSYGGIEYECPSQKETDKSAIDAHTRERLRQRECWKARGNDVGSEMRSGGRRRVECRYRKRWVQPAIDKWTAALEWRASEFVWRWAEQPHAVASFQRLRKQCGTPSKDARPFFCWRWKASVLLSLVYATCMAVKMPSPKGTLQIWAACPCVHGFKFISSQKSKLPHQIKVCIHLHQSLMDYCVQKPNNRLVSSEKLMQQQTID
jgi:hypothetical protein